MCAAAIFRAFGIAIVLVASTSNLCIRIAQQCRPLQPEAFRSLGMSSRGRSRSRSRSAERAKLLADRFAAQKGRFLRGHDRKDAAVRQRRCFNPQCSRALTTAPYELWLHVSCTATECIFYLHDETARIQTELRSLDREESIRSMKGSGR